MTNSPIRQTLLLSSVFVFAYFFGVILHEIGHVLAYSLHGISTDIFVIHPFGRNYMEPAKEVASPNLYVVYMAGTLFNLICATAIILSLWRFKSLYLLPLFGLAATSYIQESIGIILDLLGGDTFDWSIVVNSGFPIPIIALFSIILLIFGCLNFIKILTVVGVDGDVSYIRVLLIVLGIVVPFFLASTIYVLLYEEAKILSKLISLGSSILLSAVIAFFYRRGHYSSKKHIIEINNSQIVFSLFAALFLIIFGLYNFN